MTKDEKCKECKNYRKIDSLESPCVMCSRNYEDYFEKKPERTKEEIFKDSLADMVWQFAYTNDKGQIHTGGLSALEDAFSALDLPDPCPAPYFVSMFFGKEAEENLFKRCPIHGHQYIDHPGNRCPDCEKEEMKKNEEIDMMEE